MLHRMQRTVIHEAIGLSAQTFASLRLHYRDKNSSGDDIANVNFYAVRPEVTRIRWNNAK